MIDAKHVFLLLSAKKVNALLTAAFWQLRAIGVRTYLRVVPTRTCGLSRVQ